MTFSTRLFVDLSAPIVGVPILAIGAAVAEPPLLSERRQSCERPAAAPFLLERRARAHGSPASSCAVRVQRTLDVGPPRKPPPLPRRWPNGRALFEPCAAPRRALTPGRRRVASAAAGETPR